MTLSTVTSRFLVGAYLTVCSTSLISFGQSAQAQSYPCSNVALGTDTYARDQGYRQNNSGSLNQADIQTGTQTVVQRKNEMDTDSSTRSGSSSQQLNNSGSSASGSTFAGSTSSGSSRSSGQKTEVGGSYAGFGANVGYSTSNSSSNSNSQSNSGSNSGQSEFNQNQSYQSESNSQISRDGSRIDEASGYRSTSNDQSRSESYNRDRQQNDSTKRGTTVVGMNCDTAVQAESARDREMIRQRSAVEQERVRLQRDQMRQRSSDDFMNQPW